MRFFTRFGLVFAALFFGGVASAEVVNLNPHNANNQAVGGIGEVQLHWPDVKGPIAAWWVYSAEGTIAGGETAARLCERRPNAKRIGGRDNRDIKLQNLKRLKRHVFLVEVEYRNQPPPKDNDDCHYVLHMEARVGDVHRELNKITEMFIYGTDRGIAINNDKYMRASNWQIYYAEGRRTPEYMCLYKPNVFMRNAEDIKYAHIPNLKPNTLYTVMVETVAWWRWDPKKICSYAIAYGKTERFGKPETIVRNINEGFRGATHQVGDNAVWLKWRHPGGNIAAYHIYHMPGSILKNHNTATRLCNEKPNAHTFKKGTHEYNSREFLVRNVANNKVHTFLIAAEYAGEINLHHADRFDRIDCGYLYHIANTPKPVRIETLVNKNEQGRDVEVQPGDRRVTLNWRRERNVKAWHIYHTEGTVADIKKLCTRRPDPIIINDPNQTSYIVGGLENDTPYTFLIEAHMKDRNRKAPELDSHCEYSLHDYVTPRR